MYILYQINGNCVLSQMSVCPGVHLKKRHFCHWAGVVNVFLIYSCVVWGLIGFGRERLGPVTLVSTPSDGLNVLNHPNIPFKHLEKQIFSCGAAEPVCFCSALDPNHISVFLTLNLLPATISLPEFTS